MSASLAIFGPHIRPVPVPYIATVREYVVRHPVLSCIADQISTLHDVWSLLAQENRDIANLSKGPRLADAFREWLVEGVPGGPVTTSSSAIVVLPRLAIIQFAQYFQFLESRGLTHAGFVSGLSGAGGIQGFCGGLPAAAALACSGTEEELQRAMCTSVRLAFAMGLCVELGDDSDAPGVTTTVVRLRMEGQAEEMVGMFPRTYISTITDPKTVTIVGDVNQLARLRSHAVSQGLVVQDLDVRGKAHNPENAQITAELCRLCERSELLSFSPTDSLQVPLRSNQAGDRVAAGSVIKDVVEAILNSRCEWDRLLSAVATDLKATNTIQHGAILFGVGDCLPLMSFNKLGLQIKKTDWSQSQWNTLPELPIAEPLGVFPYPKDAVAIVGASCRLPGASDMAELWALLCPGDDRHEELKPDRINLSGSYRASRSGSFAKDRKFYGNFMPGIGGFDSAFFGVNPREAASMDPQQRLLLEVSYEAMECSGYTKSHVRGRGDAVGCFIGASFMEYLDNTNAHPPTAYSSTGTIGAFLSA